jgi:hypothetical protein
MEAIGSIVWFSFVTQRPLCRVPHIMATLREIARKGWDGCMVLDERVRLELRSTLEIIVQNEPRTLRDHHEPEILVEGDASDDFAAYLLYQNSTVLETLIREVPAEQHIFLSELAIAVDGCLAAYDRGHKGVEYRGDNMAALMALDKRLSTNFMANGMLQRLPDNLTVKTSYVPSEENLADPFTRGCNFPPTPCPLHAIQELHRSFRDAPKGWGPNTFEIKANR